MSGQGPGRMNDDSFKGIVKPYMATTGTRDFGAAGETPPWRLKPYDLCPPAGSTPSSFRASAIWTSIRRRAISEMGARVKNFASCTCSSGTARFVPKQAAEAALASEAQASKEADPVWLRTR